MDVLSRLHNAGIVPVVVLEKAEDAVPTANAMRAGGIDVMEITLRTKAGLSSIGKVARECGETVVGAGTVLTLDQCKACVDAGAKFIVSPGFNREMVEWCVRNNVAVTPGCVTPTEIMYALELDVHVVKFFPANVYGGLSAMKALAAPFGGVKFIPTGGVSDQNLSEYVSAAFIHAVGGSWLCAKEDIAAGNFEKITALCASSRQKALGYELAHLGINMVDDAASMDVCGEFQKAFGFACKPGGSSNFAGGALEVMKSVYLGEHGHIAIRVNSLPRAIADLEAKGFFMDETTAKFKGDAMIAVYLKGEFGGFAVHLLQK